MSKYKHDAILRAWLDGRAIQYLPEGAEVWLDIEPSATATKTPHLYTDGRAEYRIKPVTLRYRVALAGDDTSSHWTVTADSLIEEKRLSNEPYFIRWITDWIEVLA